MPRRTHHVALVAAAFLVADAVEGQEPTWRPQPAEELMRLARGREGAALLFREVVWPGLRARTQDDTVWVMAEQWLGEWLPPPPVVLVMLTEAERRQLPVGARALHYMTFERTGGDTLWVGTGYYTSCGGGATSSEWVWVGETWTFTGKGRGVGSGRSHCK